MSPESPVSPETVAREFPERMRGKLDDDKVEAAVTAWDASTKHFATGDIVSFIFYQKVHVHIQGGKHFEGNAGGLASPGGGSLVGDVYADDLETLYRDTIAFSFYASPLYVTVEFWDGNSKLLGHYQAGGLSSVGGPGGGTGGWS
jgi:Rhodococcus equi virulence-associated protein